jgi:hypothetical protein
VLSYLYNGHPLAENYRSNLEGNTAVISFMTLAELHYGTLNNNWGDSRRADLMLKRRGGHNWPPSYPRREGVLEFQPLARGVTALVLSSVRESVLLAALWGGRERFAFGDGPLLSPALPPRDPTISYCPESWAILPGFRSGFFFKRFTSFPVKILERDCCRHSISFLLESNSHSAGSSKN